LRRTLILGKSSWSQDLDLTDTLTVLAIQGKRGAFKREDVA
jgi:hypothetical protein